jgi:hypothetical protein
VVVLEGVHETIFYETVNCVGENDSVFSPHQFCSSLQKQPICLYFTCISSSQLCMQTYCRPRTAYLLVVLYLLPPDLHEMHVDDDIISSSSNTSSSTSSCDDELHLDRFRVSLF